MNKEACQKVIDRFIKEVGLPNDIWVKERIKKNPVRIEDVLNQIHLQTTTKKGWNKTMEKISRLWSACGASWNLQEIILILIL